ncbi:MAG: twin transmembrane helix small protein [Pseudomonadota bacterium]
MQEPFLIVVILAVVLVGVILAVGIGAFARGGEFNKRNANKIMRLRLVAQAVAVVLILILVASRGS